MSKRPQKPSGPPTFVSRSILRAEIEQGIEKIRRRIAEVQQLQQARVRHDDQAVRTAELNIQGTIREVFGDQSAEYHRHRYHDIWKGPIMMMDAEDNIQRKFEAGIPNTIAMLEGLIARLEEKRADMEQETVVRGAAPPATSTSTPAFLTSPAPSTKMAIMQMPCSMRLSP